MNEKSGIMNQERMINFNNRLIVNNTKAKTAPLITRFGFDRGPYI